MHHTEPKNAAELLAAMVATESVNAAIASSKGGEAKLAEYLAFVAAAFGFSVRRLPVAGYGENLLVVFNRGPNRPWMLFDSHMDTVGVAGMTIEPFAAEVRDGKLWGRGACDTKGSGAAMLWALREYSRTPEPPNNIAILFSVDEEAGMSGIRSFIENDYPTLGFGTPGVVVGEPTGMRLVAAHNGVCRVRLRTHGVAAHSSKPAEGRSAISSMARLITAFEEGYIAELSSSHRLTGRAQCSINVIRGGTAANVIPDLCQAEVDRRIVPGEKPEEVVAAMRASLAEIKRSRPEIEYEMDLLFIAPPLAPKATSPLATVASRALSQMGLPSDAIGVTYGTNAGELSEAGIDTIVLGPGDIAQAHRREEWLDLEELARGVGAYRALMASEVTP